MSSYPGLETLYATIAGHIKSQHDALICCLHWNLVQNRFKCTGVGEDSSCVESKKTELLPAGWNQTDSLYAIRYKLRNEDVVHILKVVRVEGTLLVHLWRLSDDKVVELSLETSDYVKADKLDDFDSVYSNLERLKNLVTDKLIKPLNKSTTSSSSSQTDRQTDRQSHTERTSRLEDDDPLRVPTRRPPRSQDPRWVDPLADPFSVGRGDLDPFSGASGGMLMDPFRGGMPAFDPSGGLGMPGRLPRGSVPPGARFDPIGPVGPGQAPGPGRNPSNPYSGAPDPDHLPPPGYDDMFM